MNHLFLLGFMGAGKTTVGVQLAELTGLDFIDLDALIVDSEKMTIVDIFKINGESTFRDLETEMLSKVSKMKPHVVATGGGVVEREQNRRMLRNNGTSIYLEAPLEVMIDRIKSANDRPLATPGDNWSEMRTRFERRLPFYEEAGLVVQTVGKSPGEIAREIADKLGLT